MAFLRRTWCEVHLDRITANAQHIRQMLSPACHMMGIVKADGYGHGAVEAAQAVLDGGADWLGVSNLEEGIQLRQAGIDTPILIISYTPPAEAKRLADFHLTQTVVSPEHGRELQLAASAANVVLRVHVKLDTGMSRVGLSCHSTEEIQVAIQQIRKLFSMDSLEVEGVFTHFASADEEQDDGFTQRQFDRFTALIEGAEAAGCHFTLRHCCNSAATLRFPHMHLDMVRPGIILYGLAPDRWMGKTLPWLQPAMELKTNISMVKEVPGDTALSYGRTFVTDRRTRVATVSIGYGDGYLRAASNKAFMLVGGQRVPVIGRVCMDQCMLDATDVDDMKEGMTVTAFGQDGDAWLSAEELAAWCGTIAYEVICAVSRRVPRIYMRSNVPIEEHNTIL